MQENRNGRPRNNSWALRQCSLRGSDVREVAKVFGLSDGQAVRTVMSLGLTGRVLKEQQATSRREAVRQVADNLCREERVLIEGDIKRMP